jgi:hypothetical protein
MAKEAEMAKWDIWAEGYSATGDRSGASLVKAEVEAPTFMEACDTVLGNDPLYSREALTHWGCRLFDNEQDARKRFG